MSCCGQREKGSTQDNHKWRHINLDDFKSSSCLSPLAYGWLWFLSIVAVAVYAADTFTCVNLLAFDHWSGAVQPAIPFDISKWIFSGCIIFSWVLAAVEWFRAIQTIKRESVASDYMQPLAVRLQSLRFTHGYRRFLVFASLTDSKKGNDYIAFFAYFQFQGAIRVLFAEGPRQVINAITVISVARAKIVKDGDTGLSKLWTNIEALADQNSQQAVILCSMLFTLIIWIFSALCLITAFLLYLCFLWHFIPREDGTVGRYCRRKIEKRLERAVAKNYQKMREREEAKTKRAEAEAMKYGKRPAAPERRPTLPKLDSEGNPVLSRQQTTDTLPPYPGGLSRTSSAMSAASRPITPHISEPKLPALSHLEAGSPELSRRPTLPQLAPQPTLPDVGESRDNRRPGLQRSPTSHSMMSTDNRADAPLLPHAASMGGSIPRMPTAAGQYAPRPTHVASGDQSGFQTSLPPRSASVVAPQRAWPNAAQPSTMPPARSFTDPHRLPPRGHFSSTQQTMGQGGAWSARSYAPREGPETYELQPQARGTVYAPPRLVLEPAPEPAPEPAAYKPEVYAPITPVVQSGAADAQLSMSRQQFPGSARGIPAYPIEPGARYVASPPPMTPPARSATVGLPPRGQSVRNPDAFRMQPPPRAGTAGPQPGRHPGQHPDQRPPPRRFYG